MLYVKMPKTKSTIVVDLDLWKRFRMIAILNEMEISELVEQALKEKLDHMKQLVEFDSYKDVEKLRLSKHEDERQKMIQEQNQDQLAFEKTIEDGKRQGKAMTDIIKSGNTKLPPTESKSKQKMEAKKSK